MKTDKGFTKKFKRDDSPGQAHELTFSCYKKRPFFQSELACKWMATSIENARKKHEFHLWAYVFMPDHIHLLIFPPQEDYSMSDISYTIKTSTAQKAVKHLRKNNPDGLRQLETGSKRQPYAFWQPGPGYDRNMNTATAIHNSIDYIHNNPVKAELIDYADDWHWSSAKEWKMPGEGPIAVDREFLPRRT